MVLNCELNFQPAVLFLVLVMKNEMVEEKLGGLEEEVLVYHPRSLDVSVTAPWYNVLLNEKKRMRIRRRNA